jgi:hypothetical protein
MDNIAVQEQADLQLGSVITGRQLSREGMWVIFGRCFRFTGYQKLCAV